MQEYDGSLGDTVEQSQSVIKVLREAMKVSSPAMHELRQSHLG